MYHHRHLFLRLTALLDARPSASLRSLADLLHVHAHTLAAIVRTHAGTPFSDWAAARRLALARRLLETRPELAIKEIAGLAGFGSSSALDRFLRRHTGLTPTELRCAAAAEHGPQPAVNELVRGSTDRGAPAPASTATLDPSGRAT